jgi:alkaline phosphatase D
MLRNFFFSALILLLGGCQSPSGLLKSQKELPSEISRFAFGSCAHQDYEIPILSAIQGQKPQLYVGMGDNVYASRPETKPISEAYRRMSLRPEFQSFRKAIPMIATWDDHDYGQNDGGIENPEKQEAREAFLNFFPYAKERVQPLQGGIYHSVEFGSGDRLVRFIMLDTRWDRSPLNRLEVDGQKRVLPNTDHKARVLGEDQWRWLEAELSKPARMIFLVSSIQVLSDQHQFESWSRFPQERQRLLTLLQKKSGQNIFILSGDRHRGEMSQALFPKMSLWDFTASSLNRPAPVVEETNPYRQGPLYAGENFGLAEINWERNLMFVSLRDLEGKILHAVEIKLR